MQSRLCQDSARDRSNDHRRAVRHRQHEHARLGAGGGLRAGPRALPGDLRGRGVHPRRRRAPRRRRLRRRRARRVLAVRAGLGAGSRRGGPHRLVRGDGQARHGQCRGRLRRRRRHARRARGGVGNAGRDRVLPRRHAGVGRRRRGRPQRLRELLRLGGPVDDRPDRQRDVSDAVPLRRHRRLHPRATASMPSARRSPAGPASCSTSRPPATRSTTTRARCSTTRRRPRRPGRRRWRSSASTCR